MDGAIYSPPGGTDAVADAFNSNAVFGSNIIPQHLVSALFLYSCKARSDDLILEQRNCSRKLCWSTEALRTVEYRQVKIRGAFVKEFVPLLKLFPFSSNH